MGLPKIDLPLYELELPSTGEKVKYRPFTVKEEKILLTAQESDDKEQLMTSIKQVVNNCLIGKTIEEITLFDIEYIIIVLRSKSVDNKVEFEIKDPETEENVKLELDLGNVKVEKYEEHTNKIKVNEEYTLFLKYPTIENFGDLILDEEKSHEKSYEVMISCMDKLASEEEVYKFSDFTNEEIEEFVGNLHTDTIKEMKKFFDTMPKVRHVIPYKNSEGNEKSFVIQGTESFFI